MMRKTIFFLFFAVASLLHAYATPMQPADTVATPGDTLRISILTCDPGPDVYQIFGHTAVRVQRSGENALDMVFNYGMFSFADGNFVYKFVKGETDYKLGVYDFSYFLPDYVLRGSSVVEQELNLTPMEKDIMLERLLVNARPENREYRYNFLFDNCSTRPRDMVMSAVAASGKHIRFDERDTLATFREIIRYYGVNYSWLLFGIDLALGRELDRQATWQEHMFIPLILSEACKNAQTVDADGTKQPLILNETLLYDSGTVPVLPPTPWYITPMACTLLLLVAGLFVTWRDMRGTKLSRWFDTILNTLFFVLSLIIYFLVLCSEHPATTVNINALWLTPLALIPVFVPYIRKARRVVLCYHVLNLVLLALFLILVVCRVQIIDYAFIPLVLLSALRSYNYIKYFKVKYVQE